MGRRGPAPKPAHLKLLEGNPGKRPIRVEPKPKPVAPKCPSWLDREAKREWKRVAPELEKLGLFTQIDGASLAAYCQAVSTMIRAQKELQAHIKATGKMTITYTNKAGAENEVPHPAVKIFEDAAKLVKAYVVEFGLTPAARTRMATPPAKEEEDPFEEFLRRGQTKA